MRTLLTSEEIKVILSKNKYWEEVSKRDYRVQLHHELEDIIHAYGIRLLHILADYAKVLEEQQQKVKA